MEPNYQKELLKEVTENWNVQMIDDYLSILEKRREDLDDWIKTLRVIRRKKVRKMPVDTGTRDGR